MTISRQANRNFGRITIGLMCCGPILLRGSNFWWAAPSDTTGETDGLRNIQIQIISINSSNLLIFMMRIALVLSLLYFVQVRSKRLCFLNGNLMVAIFFLNFVRKFICRWHSQCIMWRTKSADSLRALFEDSDG